MAQQYVIDHRHPKRREREEEQAGNAAASVNWDEFTPVEGASLARAERRDGEGGSQIEAFLAGRSPAKAGTIDDFLRGAPSKRSWGEVAQDTAVQLAEGVNTIIGAVPNLVAPESRAAGFFRDNAEFWRERQSDPLKARIARADQAIDAAGEDGVIAQITPVVVAVEPNGSSGRLEVVYLPSMYPRNDAQWKFPQWIRAGKLKYADKSRSRLLATTAGLELPGVVQRSVGFTPAKYMTESDRPQAGLSRGRAGGMTFHPGTGA